MKSLGQDQTDIKQSKEIIYMTLVAGNRPTLQLILSECGIEIAMDFRGHSNDPNQDLSIDLMLESNWKCKENVFPPKYPVTSIVPTSCICQTRYEIPSFGHKTLRNIVGCMSHYVIIESHRHTRGISPMLKTANMDGATFKFPRSCKHTNEVINK